jgi:NADH-quinone oxidoreductase subunit J
MTTRKIFRSAIWLLFSLIGIAALYFWLQVEFIAAVQIIVYVGGIVVLIIFSIFLTQQSGNEMPKQPLKRTISLCFGCVIWLWTDLFTDLEI